jgi:hypothetical protein
MSRIGRLCGALAIPFALSAIGAEAQLTRSALAAPVEATLSIVPVRSARPDFRMPRGALREIGPPPRNGFVATLPVADNLNLGVGRFAIPELAGRRSNMESERRPTDMRRRDRAIAAVAFSFRF